MNSARSGSSASTSKMFPGANPNRSEMRIVLVEAAISSTSALSAPMTGVKSRGASECVKAARSAYRGGTSETILGGSGGIRHWPAAAFAICPSR